MYYIGQEYFWQQKKNLENSDLNQRDVYYLFNKEVGGLRVVSQ